MNLSSFPTRIALLALFSASTFYLIYKSRRLKNLRLSLNPSTKPSSSSTKPKIFFISQTGTSKTLATRLLDLLNSKNFAFELFDPSNYEPEDLPKETLILIVASTWEDGKAPSNAKFFYNWLEESVEDFRVGSLLLKNCKFSVFGVGSRAYGVTFNAVARDVSKWMKALGASEILPVIEGDVDGGDVDKVFDDWSAKLVKFLMDGGVKNGEVLSNGVGGESDWESGDETDEEENVESQVVDLEDIAGKGPSRRSAAVVRTNGTLNGKKEMVTPVIRANLEVNGNKLKDITGSGIFAGESAPQSDGSSSTNKTGLRTYQEAVNGISQISFTAEESITPKKPTSLPEVAKQRP